MPDVVARPAMQPGNTKDPLRAYNFNLIINNVTSGHFVAAAGFDVRVEKILYREAGLNQASVRAVPGPVTYSSVTLRYGLTTSTELWDWLMSAVNGQVSRRNVTIAMLDSTGSNTVLRWKLANAWPEQLIGAPLDALSRELAIETLVLAHDGLDREVSGGAPAAGA
jgi:phage tail-like protein